MKVRSLESLFATYNPRYNESQGYYKMMCPFRENHPDGSGYMSFFANPEINAYHCFSCHVSGALTKLLTGRKFKLSLTDAVELVNITHGLDKIERYESSGLEITKLPTYEPEHILDFSRQPKVFLQRGFPEYILKKHRVGISNLEHKGKSQPTITIPMYEGRRLVGVKYRIQLKDYRTFWYSDGFKKEYFLYNKPEDYKRIIVVEGESDVWRSEQWEVPEASSTLGTEMSDWQSKEIRKYKSILLGYDNDDAGLLATEKTYLKIRSHPDVRFIPYTADDPGSSEREDWRYAVKHATDYAEYSMAMAEHLGDKYFETQERALELHNKKLRR